MERARAMERSNLDEIFSAPGLDYSGQVVKEMDRPGDGGSGTPSRGSEARRKPPLFVVDIAIDFFFSESVSVPLKSWTEIREINSR